MHRRYQLLARLEERPLSENFTAQDVADPARKYLVKLFLQRFSTPEFASALWRESGDKARAIGCPHLMPYEEVGFVAGRLAAIRTLIDGYALDDVIRRLHSKEVVLTAPLALYLVSEAARIVAQAHGQGMTHGALDSSHLLLGFDGVLRVSGLGMMRAVDAATALKPVAPKLHKAFRPPEQRAPGQSTAVGDVYALGCLAYELLTLISVASVRGGGLSTKRDTLQPPSRLNRRINARIDPVIMRALETAPSRRYQSAAQFAEALQSLFATLGSAVGPQELAHFAREVFPNEVSLTGGASAANLPFVEPFELSPQTVASEGQTSAGQVDPASAAPQDATQEAIPVRPAAPQPQPARETSIRQVLQVLEESFREDIELSAQAHQLFEGAFAEDGAEVAVKAATPSGTAGGGKLHPIEDEATHQARIRSSTQEALAAAREAPKPAQTQAAGSDSLFDVPLAVADNVPSLASVVSALSAEAAALADASSTRQTPPLLTPDAWDSSSAAMTAVPAPAVSESLSSEGFPWPAAGSDPLASWDAPAGPMPVFNRRVSPGAADDAPADPSTVRDVPLMRMLARLDGMNNSVATPSGASTDEALAVQRQTTAKISEDADGPELQPGEESSWSAFSSPPKAGRAAKAKRQSPATATARASRSGGSTATRTREEEEDWRVRPEPVAQSARPRSRHWGAWGGALLCAVALAGVVIAVRFQDNPGAARLSKEALEKLTSAVEQRARPAYLSVQTNAKATVIINGKKSPVEAPFEKMELAPGRHIVRLLHEDEVREFGLFLEEGQHELRIEHFTIGDAGDASGEREAGQASRASEKSRAKSRKTSGR